MNPPSVHPAVCPSVCLWQRTDRHGGHDNKGKTEPQRKCMRPVATPLLSKAQRWVTTEWSGRFVLRQWCIFPGHWHPMMEPSSSHKIRNIHFNKWNHCQNSFSVNYSNASFTSLHRVSSATEATQARRKTMAEKGNLMFSKCPDTEKARNAYNSIHSFRFG